MKIADKIKIGLLIGILIFGFLIPYAYSVIQGNYAVSVVDATNPIKYYTVPGTTTNGMDVDVTRVQGTVTIGQATQANLNATVFQPTGTNLHTVLDSGTLTSITNAVNVNATQTTNPWVVAGNKTNNAAVPGATNVGALISLANAANPTWTEGDLVLASSTLNGALRVVGNNPMGVSALPSITNIDYDHLTIHAGVHYRCVSPITAIVSTAIQDYLILPPNSTTRVHLIWHIETDTGMKSEFFESPTTGNNGTAMTILNSDRNSGNTASTQIFSAPSVTTTGNFVHADIIGSGKAVGNLVQSDEEFVLKQNTPYLLRVTNNGGANGNEVTDFSFYEN